MVVLLEREQGWVEKISRNSLNNNEGSICARQQT